MKIRKPITLIVAFAMVFTVFGYGFTVQADAAAKKPTKMSISSNYKTVDIKGKVTVKVKSVSPANASKAVTWKSSNKNIATVSSSGVVTGKKAGTVKITATSKSNKKLKKTVTIKVKQIKPTLSLKNVYVYTRDGYVAVKASVPSNVYNAGVSYKISGTKYAKLKSSKTSKSGYSSLKARTGYVYIAPVKATSNKVTLTATSKENKKIKKTCRVYVRQSVDAIAFDQKSAEAEAGKTIELKANVTKPSKPYSTKLVYSSSDKTVATVDKNGKVTANRPGHAKITATAKYGNRNKAKASYDLEVYENILNGDMTVIDTNKYDYYVVEDQRNSGIHRTAFNNSDILNLGDIDKTLGFDWTDAQDVKNKLEASTFDLGTSDENYVFAKDGNRITIKVDNLIARSFWYYADEESFIEGTNGDYTIKLFSAIGKDGKPIKETATIEFSYKNADKTITVEKAGYKASLKKIDNNEYDFNINNRNVDVKLLQDDQFKIEFKGFDVKSVKAFAK